MSPNDFPTDEELGLEELKLACGHVYPDEVGRDHPVAECLAILERGPRALARALDDTDQFLKPASPGPTVIVGETLDDVLDKFDEETRHS